MAEIKTLLFDMDGVFCAYDFGRRLRLLEEWTGVPAADIDAWIFKSGFEGAADRGQYGANAYVEEIARLLGAPMDADTWLLARSRSMTPYPETAEAARRLKGRYRLAMLSNNGWLLRRNIGRILPEVPEIFGEFLFFSAEIGAGKETPATFGPLLAMLGWSPASTLFIDDSPIYVSAAQEAGLQTYLFTTPEAFTADLRTLGLAPE